MMESFNSGLPIVVSFQRELHPIASWYASKTNRIHVSAESHEIIGTEDIGRVEVIFLTCSAMTGDLFDRVAKLTGRVAAPGIIFGKTLADIEQAAEQAFHWINVPSPNSFPWVDLIPKLQISELRSDLRWLVGGKANFEVRRRALTSGANVLRISSHSDGVDVHLGGGIVLCPLPNIGISKQSGFLPLCVEREWCHREGLSLREFLDSKFPIIPEEIRAQVLVLDVCHGIIPAPSTVDSDFAIAGRILRSPSVGVLIATPDFLVSSSGDLDPLCRALATGVPVGVAVHQFCQESEHRLFVFGDPGLKCRASDLSSTPQLFAQNSPEPGQAWKSDLDFAFKKSNAKLNSAESLAQSIAKYGWSRWHSTVIRTSTEMKWNDSSAVCIGCGNKLRQLELLFTGRGISNRVIGFCSVCGPVCDQMGNRVKPTLSIGPDNTIRMEGGDPKMLSCVAAIWGYTGSDMRILRWPDKKGCLRLELNCFDGLAPGLWRIGCIAIGETWELQSYPTRFLIDDSGLSLLTPKYHAG